MNETDREQLARIEHEHATVAAAREAAERAVAEEAAKPVQLSLLG